MKKLFVYTALSLFSVIGAFAQTAPKVDASAKKDTPVIVFDKTDIDLGKIPGGVVKPFEFVFTNTGNEPLIINSVSPGCGCTIVEKPNAPILKGQKAVIKGSYNGSGNGVISKNITVSSNAKTPSVLLTFKATVEPQVAAPAPATAEKTK
jgi:hypothetical protein